MEIYAESLRLAEQQMRETEDRIEVGTLAKTEFFAAQAEVALRRENLINAKIIGIIKINGLPPRCIISF